jgi:hypothetical protein
MRLQDLYFNPSATILGVTSNGYVKVRYLGKDCIVTEAARPCNTGDWMHVRVSDEQRAQLDADNIAYDTFNHAAIINQTVHGGPAHIFGVDGEKDWWIDTQGDLVCQGPEDSEPIVVEEGE